MSKDDNQELIRNCKITSCKHNNNGSCGLPPGNDCTEATVVENNAIVKNRNQKKGKKWYEVDK